MPLNHFVTLGKSGLRVSPLCLGTMTFGEDWGFGAPVDQSEAVLARYLEKGGNFIDTANVYTKGHSEKIIGDYLSKAAVRRDRLVIATKFFGTLYPGDPNAGGAGRKSLMAACEQSLRRLRCDYIDLYWMHCWDPLTPIEETMRALDDLVRAGKVRYVGFSDTPAWKTAQAHVTALWKGWTPLSALQVEYSLLQRTVEGELIPLAQELGLGVAPWSPLKAGALSGKFKRATAGTQSSRRGGWVTSALNEKTYAVVDALEGVARETGSTVARAALAWVQGRPGVTSTIVGASSVAQLEDNLAALELTLAPRHLEALDALTRPALNFPFDFVNSAGGFRSGGTTINGQTHEATPLNPKSESEVY